MAKLHQKSTSMGSCTKKLPELDVLRILSIVIVVLFLHIPIYYAYNFYTETDAFTEFSLLTLGVYTALGSFVFLSGFCLFLNRANRNINSVEKLSAFLKKRFLRIFPLYWIALALFLILFEPNINGIFLLSHVVGAQIIVAPLFGSPIFTLWFIGIIVVYYLIFVLLSYMGSIKKIIPVSLIVLLCFSVLYFRFNLVDFRFFEYYPSFICGIIAAGFYTSPQYQKLKEFLTNKHALAQPLIALIVAAISWLVYNRLAHYFFPIYFDNQKTLLELAVAKLLPQLVIAVFICLILSVSHLSIRAFTLILDRNHINTALSRVAYSTFAVYLFHRPFLVLFNFVMHEIFNLDILEKSNFPLTLLALPILFILAYLIQKTADKGISRISNYLASRRTNTQS